MMWYQTKLFRLQIGIILILIILFLTIQLSPILNTIFEFVITLVTPLIMAGILYYILRPLRDFLERMKIPRLLAIPLIYLFLLIFISLVVAYVWPSFSKEINQFMTSPSGKIEEVKNKTIGFMNFFNFAELTTMEMKQWFNAFLKSIMDWLKKDVLTIIGEVTKVAIFIIFTPIILFYLLKDSGDFNKMILMATPKAYRAEIKMILEDFDETLSTYISGQFIVAMIIAALVFLGYSLIGLPYAFLLAMFAFVFNMIPFIGTIIATIPAFIVGFGEGAWMGIEVLFVIAVVHALDANFISPNVIGRRLHIHPLTIILLLLACGSLYGIVGLLLATPIYALLKVLYLDLYAEKD